MTDRLSVAIAAGGTAGHVNPALALAEELSDRGHAVRFFGQTRRLEGTLVPKAGFPFFPVEVTGFDRRGLVDRARAAPPRPRGASPRLGVPSTSAARRRRRVRGLCGAPARPRRDASRDPRWCFMSRTPSRGSPTARAPRPPRWSPRRSRASARCSERAGAKRIEFTGNPVLRSVLSGDRARGRAALGIPEDAVLLLAFGGSLGAQHINRFMVSIKDELLSRSGVYVLHSCGAEDFDATRDALALTADEAERYRVQPISMIWETCIAASDLVLSRAGASSVAEIAALAVPSVLVPYPHATADHRDHERALPRGLRRRRDVRRRRHRWRRVRAHPARPGRRRRRSRRDARGRARTRRIPGRVRPRRRRGVRLRGRLSPRATARISQAAAPVLHWSIGYTQIN